MQSADCMRHRSMLIRYALPLVAVAALALVFVLRGCGGERTPTPVATASAEAAAGSEARSAARAQAVAEAELRQHYESAMRAAVSTLHRYLAKLPEDHAAADAFWSGGAPAADATEADLRALASPPRQFRSRNRAPSVLEGDPLPTAVRIPVDLRLVPAEGPMRRYAGWYELRHEPAGDAWRITAASVDALPAAQ
jgi:hypothetical protein